MTPSSYLKAAAVLAVTAALTWGGYTLYRSGGAGQRANDAVAAVAQAGKAATSTKTLQDKVNATNTRLRALEQERLVVRERLAAAEQRVLDNPGASDAADASAAALRDYAEEVERDFAECRAEVAALADEAAGASDAAHALYDSWPALRDWNAAARSFSNTAQGLTK